MGRYGLDFGPLSLNDDNVGTDYSFRVFVSGFSLGSAEAVKAVAASLMRDGSDSRIDRYENRTVSFRVVISGADSQVLAEGERALGLQIGRRNVLAVTPPDGYGATTNFVVLTSTMSPEFDGNFDLAEMRGRPSRTYSLSFECLPFGRSTAPVVESFPPGASAPTITNLDPMTSTANWTQTGAVSVTTGTVDSDTYLSVNVDVGPNRRLVRLSKTATVTTSDYVTLTVGDTYNYSLIVNGVAYGAIASEDVSTANAWKRRLWYYVGAGSSRTVSVEFEVSDWTGTTRRYFDLGTSADIPAGAARQLPLKGSARTPADISIAASGSSLGPTLVITGPLVGKYRARILTASPSFTTSTDYFSAPPGAYGVVVFFASAPSPTTVTVSDDTSGQSITKKIRSTDLIQMIGTIHLGGLRGGGSITRRLSLSGGWGGIPGGSMFLIPLADGHAMTVGDYASKYLWLEAPDLEEPLGGVFAGALADGSDAKPAWASTRRHVSPLLDPPVTGVYVFPEDATLGDSYFPAWQTYAAE